MEHKLVRSARKTLAIEITSTDGVVVRAPKRAPLYLIDRLLLEKRDWIEGKLHLIAKRRPEAKSFSHGETFIYLGMGYQLTIVDGQTLPFTFNNKFCLASSQLPRAREYFLAWYKEQANILLKERVAIYSVQTGIKYNMVKITGADKRWGSCNSMGNLHFSWRLIMAPLAVIDYVVVHELVHILEKNHAARFWSRVKEIMPGYKQQRAWLKEQGHRLAL